MDAKRVERTAVNVTLPVLLCEWCDEPMPPWIKRKARTCSKPCRQALQRFGIGAADVRARKPMRFGYADPPYPGLAWRYYRMPEVDHALLVDRLVSEFPDGWALSTSSDALGDVLELCLARVPNRKLLRTGAWVRGARGCVSMYERQAWEPLIVYAGRGRRREPSEPHDDVLLCPVSARPRSHKGALIGMKPPAFCEWMFRRLGAARGDELVDLFPGSGVVGRAWRMFQRDPAKESRTDARRTPSRLAGAARHLAETLKRKR